MTTSTLLSIALAATVLSNTVLASPVLGSRDHHYGYEDYHHGHENNNNNGNNNNNEDVNYIGNNNGWNPAFAATGWNATTAVPATGFSLFYTGSSTCNGIQHVTKIWPNSYVPTTRRKRAVYSSNTSYKGNSNTHGGSSSSYKGNSNSNSHGGSSSYKGNSNSNSYGGSSYKGNTNSYGGSSYKGETNSYSGKGNTNTNSNFNENDNENLNEHGDEWYPANCLSNTGANAWGINLDAAYTVTSTASASASEVRLFYWSTDGSSNVIIRDAYWTPTVETATWGSRKVKRASTYTTGHTDTTGNYNNNYNGRSSSSSSSTSSTASSTSTTSSASSTSTTSSHATTTSTGSSTSTHTSSTASATTSTLANNFNLANVSSTFNSNFNEECEGGGFYEATGTWHVGMLSHVVVTPWTGGLASVSWVNATTGTIGRTVFYVQGGWLKQMTLLDGAGAQWANLGHEGIQLFFNPGELTATSWIDSTGTLQIRVYVLNADTNELVEYDWNAFNSYTFNNNLYASTVVYTHVSSASANMDATAGEPTVQVFTSSSVGSTDGLIEQVSTDAHGSDAVQGTQIASASIGVYGGASGQERDYVFFLDNQGTLMESFNIGGTWTENIKVYVE